MDDLVYYESVGVSYAEPSLFASLFLVAAIVGFLMLFYVLIKWLRERQEKLEEDGKQ